MNNSSFEKNNLDKYLALHAPRTWQRMLSGRRLNLLDPSPLDIEIEDIALGLSRNTRWNGQTEGKYGWSVAQHSNLVVDIVKRLDKRASAEILIIAMLHDAAEYVTHDLITPLKSVVGDVFKEVEIRLTKAIHIRFSLPVVLNKKNALIIKRADRIAAATEAFQLAGFSINEIRSVLKLQERPLKDLELLPVSASKAKKDFLSSFKNLEAMRVLQQRRR